MPIVVTLHVFSGLPDPVWVLSEEQAKEFLALIRSVGEQTALSALRVVSGLGYRGFSVSLATDHAAAEAGFPSRLFLAKGIMDVGPKGVSLFDRSRAVETWLLSTAGGNLSEAVRGHVQEVLGSSSAGEDSALVWALPKRECVPRAVDAPLSDATAWNKLSIQLNNNCYNYANNKVTGTFARPGRAHGIAVGPLSCPTVQASALADSLISAPSFNLSLAAGQGWYVALAIWPNHDFHWYRQDADGCWSHKRGNFPVSSFDNQKRIIRDPQHCNRGPYVDFCAYMITNSAVLIS